MISLKQLKAAILAGASTFALTTAANANDFDIPGGDLKSALDAYMKQARVALMYPDDELKGVHTKGAKGELTAGAALSRILSGTGFVTQHESGAIAVVRGEAKPEIAAITLSQVTPVRLAAAASIESVVVTSSKIKGDIQTVPIAITALSQEQLTERQIAGGPDLVKEVPNLTFSKTNFTGYNLQIRGIGTQAISVTIDPAVAVAFNDTPFLRNHFFEQEFFDVNQVEILRGPQGTLFGRNANAGVVNLVSAKPTNQFEAMLSADWGNYLNRRYEGMVNIPIVDDKLALRIAGEWTKRDGYAFNEVKNRSTDGRDLWSSRVSLRWRPTQDLTTDFIWEHFQEADDRLRSGKQLCKTDPGPDHFISADGHSVHVDPASEAVYQVNAAVFSQGCLPVSLYSPESREAPNGYSLPFITGAGFFGFISSNVSPYNTLNVPADLRKIQSEIDPIYKADNDTLEFNAEWRVSPTLTFNSETGYNRDFLWSTEDFNRFDTNEGILKNPGGPLSGPLFYTDPDNGYDSFCDPQLGCSSRLLVQDLATEKAWQLSQEFRLSSDFQGPFNFSAGGNYLHYETDEKYYVFSNTFSLLGYNNITCSHSGANAYVPGVTNNLFCLNNGRQYDDGVLFGSVPHGCTPGQCPQYVDPSPITALRDDGHNYFISNNPYTLNSYALFGEAYYNITSDLKLTGGLRWTDDQKHFPLYPSRLLTAKYGNPQSGVIDQSWKKFSGRGVVNWTPKLDFTDQTMVYASYAHGYKAGGANPPPAVLNSNGGSAFPTHPLTFEPEYIDAFELGTKNTLLDGALVFDADVFYYDYKAYQISQIVDRTSVNINVDATVQGAEIQTTWSAAPGLKFGFNGGYEDTRIKDNQFFIDLIDRTAGHPGWVIMKPWPGEASNCILPEYVTAALVEAYRNYGQGNQAASACGYAYHNYGRGYVVDPVTGLQYDAETDNGTHAPTGSASSFANPPTGYPGYDSQSVDPNVDPNTVNNGLGLPPNNGEGFVKNVGGNELPNAPHFTASLTGDYTMPVSVSWAATLHSDFYWQSQSWGRIFNSVGDKIRGYSNVNLALILNDATGWQAMGYVKNVFDATAITGTFLNSDDTGLTTNVFLTDPRLYGLRVTKQFGDDTDGGFNLFSGDGRPQFWLTLGGAFNATLAADNDPYLPGYTRPGGTQTVAELMVASGLPGPTSYEKAPKAGFDWEGKLVFQPEGSDWLLKAGIRYGRSSRGSFVHKSEVAGTRTVEPFGYGKYLYCSTYYASGPGHYGYSACVHGFNHKFVDARAKQSERHVVMDFDAGKDVGIGLFGHDGTGTISAGVRTAEFDSFASADLNTDPDISIGPSNVFHNVYESKSQEHRSFKGLGPEVTWDAKQPIWGTQEDGEVTLDWGLNAGLIFGRQSVNASHFTSYCHHSGTGGGFSPCASVYGGGAIHTQTGTIKRSRRVTVPNLGGYIGASVVYKDAKISLGYRGDTFFNAMDGGQDVTHKYDRGFYGPYLNVSLGMGG